MPRFFPTLDVWITVWCLCSSRCLLGWTIVRRPAGVLAGASLLVNILRVAVLLVAIPVLIVAIASWSLDTGWISVSVITVVAIVSIALEVLALVTTSAWLETTAIVITTCDNTIDNWNRKKRKNSIRWPYCFPSIRSDDPYCFQSTRSLPQTRVHQLLLFTLQSLLVTFIELVSKFFRHNLAYRSYRIAFRQHVV